MQQVLWDFTVAGGWEAGSRPGKPDLGLVVTVCLADQRGSQSCVPRAVLEGAVQCCSGDKSYFGINWKWLIICREQDLLHLLFPD